MSQRPDYLTLGLAALAGAAGALATQALVNWIATPPENTPNFSHRRRASLVAQSHTEGAQRRQISVLAFDMDGTLIKTEQIWYLLLSDAAKHFHTGNEINYEDWLHNHFGQSMEDNVEVYFKGYATLEELDEFCCTNYHKFVSLLEVLPGAVDILTFANQITNNKTYIVTNCPRRIADVILSSNLGKPIADQLRNGDGSLRILCAGDRTTDGSLLPKPSISMFNHLSSIYSVSSHEMILLGDSVYDIAAIQAAGGVGILISDPNAPQQPQSDPIKVPMMKITSLAEFYQIQGVFDFKCGDF